MKDSLGQFILNHGNPLFSFPVSNATAKSRVQRWKRPRRPRCGERSAQRGKMSAKEKVWKRSPSEKARINAAQSECMHTNLGATNRIRSAPAISFATMPLSIYPASERTPLLWIREQERRMDGWMGCCAQMSATPTDGAAMLLEAHFSIGAFCFPFHRKARGEITWHVLMHLEHELLHLISSLLTTATVATVIKTFHQEICV
jgi:hypothetical protein